MRKVICILFVIAVLICPSAVLAADYMVNINVLRQEDGTTCGELWYNNQMIWRLAILSDGAKPVSGFHSKRTTFVAPDVVNGLFLIKVE
ncbi:MAG: hypothetical protein K0R78_2522 [Pelosinus sp.]|jgi:hypothetical protein|nr:hypothetical protein [Pelosinus sp.]